MNQEKLKIIKVGGNILDTPNYLKIFLETFTLLSGKKILIHGGGKIASDIAKRLQVETKQVNGRRITDDAMLEIITMVYGGLINKKIVAALQQKNCQAIGLTGVDGNLIQSSKRPIQDGIDFGWVGDPSEVNVALLENLLYNKFIPVLAPITHNRKGSLLNTNADTIANTVASKLAQIFQITLIYVFEFDGVLEDIHNPNSSIKKINRAKYTELKKSKIIAEGMIPKLDNAFDALENGVTSVKIIKYNALEKIQNTNFEHYTQLC